MWPLLLINGTHNLKDYITSKPIKKIKLIGDKTN